MSLPNKQTINIGLPNQSANSDSLFEAFTKTQQNFETIFSCASPFSAFVASTGINIESNANSGIVTITNAGVTELQAGPGIILDSGNGVVKIEAASGAGNGFGTVTSVGISPVSNNRLSVFGPPIISSGNISIDLAPSGATAGTYNNPNVQIDQFGRVLAISNGSISGSVTSVGLTPGPGVGISGGPITSAGNIIVTNTGVTRINPGSGISVSSGNGNVTISAIQSGGSVTSVNIASSQLLVTGSPIISSGTINVNLPNDVTFTGNADINVVTTTTLNTDNINYDQTYGSFSKTANVSFASADTVLTFDWFLNTAPIVNDQGVSVIEANPSRIVIERSGDYQVFMELQAKNSSNQPRNIFVWLSKNGSDLPYTAKKIVLTQEFQQLVSKQWLLSNINANDYIEIKHAVDDISDLSLEYISDQNSPYARPEQPSASITICPIGA